MAINPRIKQKAEDIRSKIFGSEVRESLASGIEAISEDVEATIGRQGYVEEQFQDVLDETTGKDVINGPEVIAARNGEANLKTRLDKEKQEVTAQLQHNEQVLAGIDRTFGDQTFATLTALQSQYPTGDDKRYLVASDGKWYWWNGTAWTPGQVVQPIGIVEKSVKPIQTTFVEEDLTVGDTIQLITSPLGIFGDYYDPSTGIKANTGSTQSYRPTAQIPTLAFKTFKSFGVASWVYFNATGNWVGKNAPPTVAQQATWVDLTVPEGAAYMIGNVKDQFFPIGDPKRSAYPLGVLSATYKELKYVIPKLFVSEDNLSSGIKNNLNKRFSEKIIVNFGDSTFEVKNPSVSDVISDNLGAEVVNGGFGGCMMTPHPNTQYAKFSMVAIADAIATGDWSLQEGATGVPASFKDTVTRLQAIDWTSVFACTIGYGTNDWLDSKTLDNPSNPYDKAVYLGALRYSIRRILQAYPNIRILICPPIFRSTNDRSENSYNWTNGNGQLISVFVDGLISVGKERHIPVADTFYGLGINEHNERYYYPENDGTHLNPNGRILHGNKIANEIAFHF